MADAPLSLDPDFCAEYKVPPDADLATFNRIKKNLLSVWHPDRAGETQEKLRLHEAMSKKINADFDWQLTSPEERARKRQEEEIRREEREREAEYQRRAQEAASNESGATQYEEAFSSTGASSSRSHQAPPPPPPPPPRPRPQPASGPVPPPRVGMSFSTILTLLFWGAIAVTVYKGCDALSEQARNKPDRSNGVNEPTADRPARSKLVTAHRLGLIRLGMSREAVESILSRPDDVEIWRKLSTYQRLIYRTRQRQTNIFLCASTNEVSEAWTNLNRYRSTDGLGYGDLAESLEEIYEPDQLALLFGDGSYDRDYYSLRFDPPREAGRCGSEFLNVWLSYGVFANPNGTRIDAIGMGWDVGLLAKLGRDSYTAVERAQFGQLSP